MDQETTDTQQLIIQHLHKLLEKPGDWHQPSGGIWDWGVCWAHRSGLEVRWDVDGFKYVEVSFPGAQKGVLITDPNLWEVFENTFAKPKPPNSTATQLLAFLESLPQ